MKKTAAIFSLLLLFAILPARLNASGETKSAGAGKTAALIQTAYGTIEIKFFPEAAPRHVENFIKLAKDGFYDGTIFHAAVPGFMIQGGDPLTKTSRGAYTGCCPDKRIYGSGGPGWTVPAEFNGISHKRGIVSMVRFKDPDSAGSQFFIVVKDTIALDGKYTVFGEVTDGMDVVDRIVALPKNRDIPYLPEERVEMRVRIVE